MLYESNARCVNACMKVIVHVRMYDASCMNMCYITEACVEGVCAYIHVGMYVYVHVRINICMIVNLYMCVCR